MEEWRMFVQPDKRIDFSTFIWCVLFELELNDDPVRGQECPCLHKANCRGCEWPVRPVASYLVGVGAMSHPCFANWGGNEGEERQRETLQGELTVKQ